MRLVSFSVQKYRSITKGARKIALGDYTVLLRPNNEGKSNVLHALNAAMDALRRYRQYSSVAAGVGRSRPASLESYQWDRDFPLQLKGKSGTSDITLEFELTEAEVGEFRREIKSKLNGHLPVRISIGEGKFNVSIPKQGKAQAPLNKKAELIARFLSTRISFNYIPAVRTADSAAKVVQDLLDSELGQLERDPKYQAAVAKIEALQKPLLQALSISIQATMGTFLSGVKSVDVQTSNDSRYRALRRSVEVMIDDGVETSLSRKGDGVQSLVALAMMRHASERRTQGTSSIIAIEEPESHLHPKAIHELRKVIGDLSKGAQVVVTSHSPLFVNRDAVASNVIVSSGQAWPATGLKEVRDILGVRFSDNLHNSELVLLVEGSDDARALAAILRDRDEGIREAIAEGRLTLDHLGGGSNLSHKTSYYVNAACAVHAFVDFDISGKSAGAAAIADGLLTQSDINYATAPGMTESEMEDLYDLGAYADALKKEFLVDLRLRAPGHQKGKWSEITGKKFHSQGKQWNDHAKERVKNWLSIFAADHPSQMIHPTRIGAVDGLVAALRQRLDLKP